MSTLLHTIWRPIFVLLRSAVFTVFWVALLLAYGRYVEPQWVLPSHNAVTMAELKAGLPIRIVQISDLHGQEFNRPGRLAELVNRQKPDVLVLTGDAVDGTVSDLDYLDRNLTPLQARFGKYFVLGNNEYSAEVSVEALIKRVEKAGFVVLRNSNTLVDIQGQKLWLVGVDDPSSGRADLAKALKGVGAGPKVLLSHSPEIIDQAAKAKIDLVLAGHTHGGQIRIPGIGNMVVNVAPEYEAYVSGMYEKDSTALYVNRGIGETRLPFRLFAPPEVAVLDLDSAKTETGE